VSACRGDLRPQILLALGGLLGSTAIAAAPLDIVRDCAHTASLGLSGVKSLEAVCPELDDALAALGLDEVLMDGWRLRLSVHVLRDLVALQERYNGSKWPASPSTATLPGILEALQQEQEPDPDSWWSSFAGRLKEWLAHSDAWWAPWLNRWLDWVTRVQPSMTPSRMITYSLGILVVLTAVVVILLELKAAGVLRGRTRNAAAGSPATVPGAPAGSGMGQLAIADGLAELLRLLVVRLLQTGRLKAHRNLTHRELVSRSAFDSESQRTAFAAVASAAECLLYGPRSAAPEHLEPVIEKGRSLLAQLSNSSSAT